MKKKYLLVILTAGILTFFLNKSMGVNWQYFIAGIVYGGQSAIKNEILFCGCIHNYQIFPFLYF